MALALSWRLAKTWQKCEMPDRAAPLPEDLLQALAGCLLLQNKPEMSLALLVGFYCLLRTGELLALQACHVQISPKQDFIILNLGFTKTSQRTGAEDSMTLRVDFVCRALAKWKSQVSPQTFLVPFSSYIFRQQFDSSSHRAGQTRQCNHVLPETPLFRLCPPAGQVGLAQNCPDLHQRRCSSPR